MPYEEEDEVDWSDGSLDHSLPPTSNSISLFDRTSASKPTINDSSLQPGATVHEQKIIPPQPSLPLSIPVATQNSKSPSQHPENVSVGRSTGWIGVRETPVRNRGRSNRRQPSKDELSKFALYQANQKTYEAVFLKAFVTHALHPDRLNLNECLGDNPDKLSKIKDYLQAVSSNVSQVTNKMIWNAHFKSINFLSKDGQGGFPFFNVDSFKEGLFHDFGPENSFPVVQKMNQSWHRSYNASSMIQQSVANYAIGIHRSPFEDVEEATSQKLFNTKGLPAGRVIKPPMKKNKSTRTARSDSKVTLQGRRLLSSVPRTVSADTTSKSPRTASSFAISNAHDTSSIPAPNVSGMPHLDIANTIMLTRCFSGPVTTLPDAEPSLLELLVARSNSDTSLPNNGATRLETLVAQYDPDVIMHGSEPSTTHGQKEHWRMRLINDHKRRLAKRRLPWKPSGEQPQDIKSIVARAVDRGILQPPSAKAQKQINKLAAREKRALVQATAAVATPPFGGPTSFSFPLPEIALLSKNVAKLKKRSGAAPRKKPKISNTERPPPPHPSGSKTLEPHQVLPGNAYFIKTYDNEKPVWRCGINHCLGYYYNAGDRKSCIGCFTNINYTQQKKFMDFYLPSMTYSYQYAPGAIWKPSKEYMKVRKSTHMSHNTIAKIAYWAAKESGATDDKAWQEGKMAVNEHLRPKPKPEPSPEPTPEPEPEPVDLGPHPSGSKTMEHGQGIPECHYFEKKERYEEFAWRCDGGHALGRYYMAGDKKTCPGCGLNKSGLGRRAEMDFYMPPSAVVRQEAPDLVTWRPRKPSNTYKKGKGSKLIISHNQLCTKKYWEAIEEGRDHDDALHFAIMQTDAYLDAKNEEVQAKQEEIQAKREASEDSQEEHQDSSASGSQTPEDGLSRNSDGGVVISLVPRKRGREELDSDSEDNGEEDGGEGYAVTEEEPAAEVVEISSVDESSSSSDSE